MPSVGMRRSTRVFVPKTKDGDGVRVLRSGRRLWVESVEAKIKVSGKGTDGVDLFRLIHKSNDALGFFSKGITWRCNFVQDSGLDPMGVDFENAEPQLENRELPSASMDDRCRFGAVYSRKRKRFDLKSSDRMSGLHYVRRKRGRVLKRFVHCDDDLGRIREDDAFLYVSVDSSCAESCRFAGVLSSVLRRMCTAKVGLVELSLFLVSPPVAGVFGSCGIHFLMNRPSNKGSGFCKIYGASDFTPLFDINFLAAPFCFFHLHAEMWFRSLRLSTVLMNDHRRNEDYSNLVDQGSHNSRELKTLTIPLGVSRSPGGFVPESTRDGRKRRKRSLQTRRARNPSSLVFHRAIGSSVQKSSTSDIKLLKSNLAAMGKDIDSVSCSANLLVIESDRCYRETGALVKLELSASNEWTLAVRKDGSLRFYHKARNDREVKPYCTNRYTCAILWGVENGWKLEFPVRKDWMVFKELFKVCGERNSVPPLKVIPIPGVFEVSACGVCLEAPFVRPESYVRMEGNELSRALLKGTANYDLDSEDEQWLLSTDIELHVTEEAFESIIFELEKAFFSSPDDFADEEALTNRNLKQYRREAVEAVYRYWMEKRKRNRAPLLSVFKLYKPEEARLVKKPVPRKKRSMKQGHTTAKAAQSRRGKQIGALRALYDEKTVTEPDEARAAAAAKRASEIAIAKRERARRLAESADLAVYRATMAVRIAEAAQSAHHPGQVIAHLLD